MTRGNFFLLFSYIAALGIGPTASYACPKISGLIDFNCDQKLRITATGDSIVAGSGDDRHRRLGYIPRIKERIPGIIVGNSGIPGIGSHQLLRYFKKEYSKESPSPWAQQLINSDILIIGVGVNDYWAKTSPNLTVHNIERVVTFLRNKLKELGGTTPFVVVSTLTKTGRSYQQPFVDRVNDLLLQQRSLRLPVYLRFEKLPTRFLRPDHLHPGPLGYEYMADVAAAYISGLAERQELALRPDVDHDGVFDLFERSQFGTDPELLDTDGDELSDGLELFTYHTNPLSTDSDGDGIDDFTEAMVTPTSTPTPLPTPTETPTATPTATASPSPTPQSP